MNYLMQQWIEKLESDQYRQGSDGFLRKGNEFCCLGVAADLIDHDGWELFNMLMHFNVYKHENCAKDSAYDPCYYLNPQTCEKLGITHLVQKHLALMNDQGRTFKEIAAWLRQNCS